MKASVGGASVDPIRETPWYPRWEFLSRAGLAFLCVYGSMGLTKGPQSVDHPGPRIFAVLVSAFLHSGMDELGGRGSTSLACTSRCVGDVVIVGAGRSMSEVMGSFPLSGSEVGKAH